MAAEVDAVEVRGHVDSDPDLELAEGMQKLNVTQT
jgi:hypothetical protein